MAKRYAHSKPTVIKFTADYLDQLDEEMMQALVTAGAVVALADGHVKPVERDELLNFIEQQGFVPKTSKRDAGEVFDSRLRQLEDGHTLGTIIRALRPLAGLSLSSTVVRTAEHVAMADRELHPSELEALNVIRRLLVGSANRNQPIRAKFRCPRTGTNGRSKGVA